MAKTRAREGESKGKEIDSEDQTESRLTKLEEMFAEQNRLIAEQNKVMTKQFADLFVAMSRSTAHKVSDDQSNLDHGAPRSSQAKEVRSVNSEFNRENKRVDHGQERSESHHAYRTITRMGKIDFPRFDGSKFKSWLFKTEQFFGIDFTPEDLRVKMAAIHFDDEACNWHKSFIEDGEGLEMLYDWKGYVELLRERFEDECEDPMAELKVLQETDGIMDYHKKFESIKVRVKLSEEHLVSAYLAGLRVDTQMHVRMFKPKTVKHCFFLGKTYEKACPKKPVSSAWESKNVSTGSYTRSLKETTSDCSSTKGTSKPVFQPAKKLSTQEMNERRSKGLCFLCDEKYTPEHYLAAHKKTQLFCMEVEDEFEDAEDELSDGEEQLPQKMPRISVNAVSGISDYRTMRVKGTYGNKTIFVLIDSGSTHNFLDSEAAAKLGCRVDKTGLTQVSVADGRRLKVNGKVKDFEWKLQSTTFQSDILLIPLQGVDMVLGVQWLEPLGHISWNFKQLEMRFKYKGQRVVLNGIKDGSVRDVKAQKLQKMKGGQIQMAMMCVHEISEEEDGEICTLNAISVEEGKNSMVEKIVEGFPDVFAEPSELPPFQTHHDHKFKLLEGSDPVNQRPYSSTLILKLEP